MGNHDGVGILNITGAGTYVQSEGWRIGDNTTQGYAVVNIGSGSTMDGVWWENHVNKSGTVNIYTGGTYRIRGQAAFTVDGSINIQGGVLILEGSRLATVQQLVNTGHIIGNGIAHNVTVQVDPPDYPGWTVARAIPEPMTMVLLGLGGLFLRRRNA